jgi:Holliday junction resolvase-like predicted endonuclease
LVEDSCGEQARERGRDHEQVPDRQDGEIDLLACSSPSTYRCECGFSGRRWDFDSTNPIREKYRRKEQEATDYHEERSARKNRIHARYDCAIACPECDAFGDSIRAIEDGDSR